MNISTLTDAVWLGIVEGVTEFLPVSSTGHLILAEQALHTAIKHSESFSIFIQLGAILAVVLLYRDRFFRLLDFTTGRSLAGFRGYAGLFKLALACLPAFILGALLHSTIKALLFKPLPVAAALIAGGIVLIVIDRKKPAIKTERIEDLPWRVCLGVGLFQCLAMWPGISRSGATIVGAMLLGVSRQAAAEFSFLVAVPVMCAAVSYDILKSYKELVDADWLVFGVGFVVSFITAVAAVKLFITAVQRFTLAPFGWYRIALGIVVLAILA